MAVLTQSGRLTFYRLSLDVTVVPALFEGFIKANPRTREIEALAANVVNEGFEAERLKELIREVCRWGGYAGIGGRVVTKGNVTHLTNILAAAYTDCSRGNVCAGLERLQSVKGLGPSFASKHLRFLVPDRAVVLDSKISSHLGYPLSLAGYGEFVAECQTVLDVVRQSGVRYPGWAANGWRISDIEAAIFRSLSPQQEG